MDNLGIDFMAEIVGTALLLLLGTGVVANVVLIKTNGFNGGALMINFGWGLAVFAGVEAAYASGAHLNPAVTLGLVASGAKTFGNPGAVVDVTPLSVIVFILGQMIGAMIGAVLCWLAYKKHFDELEQDPANKLAVFSTGPGIRNYAWNVVTEVIATFVLVFVVIAFGHNTAGGGLAALGALPVALLVVGIGASLGGPTGYAINPARDLGPRIIHAILPIPGKGSSNWSYAWVPVVGPVIGGLLAGWLSIVLLPALGK
ncbi:MIP/aquaporin family protein [Gryllotalpicola kribbensis]|uniref:MIP/aquaporin family protein n=2 Tax=Gryllotalpicola kribbensis TaxID=993084 RepID=A0ABP8AUE1_9MICO